MKSKENISAVIFDMDGLMFDTERIAIEAWQRAGHACHCEISEALISQSVGRNIHDTRLLFTQALGTSLDFERARALRVQYAADIIAQRGVPLKDGLFELLDVLGSYAICTAVATSTERARAETLLHQAQVLPRIDVVVCGDEVSQGKPAPDIFLLAAEKLRVNPQDCVVLEDSESGVRAAAHANMHPVMIPDITSPSQEMFTIAEHIVPNLHAVVSYIKHICTNTQ